MALLEVSTGGILGTMRALLLLAVALTGGARAQPPPGDLLQRVTQKVLDTVDRLPKYMCTQTIDRFQYESHVTNQARNAEAPCDAASDPGGSGHAKARLFSSDRLRLDVAVTANQEMYSWVGESEFEDRSLFELVGNGALSTGSFALFLSVIFRTDNAGFSYKGPVMEDGRRLEEFEFRVPREMSHYIFRGAFSRVTTGYYGSILVDPSTADLVRLVVHTDALPAETGACQSSSTMDYTRLRLNDTDFLLPRRAELHILDTNGTESRNTTVFSNCHEFLGESTLSFDAAPEVGTAADGSGAPRGELPVGIPFRIAFTRNIDPAVVAAGDKLSAKLTDPMKDENRRVLAPKGAAVTLRVLEVRRFYEPRPALRLALKPETIEIGGIAQPLTASPDTQPPPFANQRTSSGHSPAPISRLLLDNRDPGAGVLQFWNISEKYVVPGGFESNWFTAGYKQ